MRCRSISSLLITVILFTALVPAHYHLHHVDASAHGHEHTIDLHLITANGDQSHHDEATSIFAATPDAIVKKASFDLYPYLLMTVMLVVLTLYRRARIRRGNGDSGRIQHRAYFSPPLRAPPPG